MLGVGKQAVAAINVLIGCYTFLTGLHVDQVRKSLITLIKKNVFLQIICFFKKIHCAVPGLSFMYSFQGNTLNKVVYDYWLQIQVLHCNFSSHAVPAFLGKSNL